MLETVDDRSDAGTGCTGVAVSLVADMAGLPGVLFAGVFDREIQTPSTSMPLSIALTPNGISLPFFRRPTLEARSRPFSL